MQWVDRARPRSIDRNGARLVREKSVEEEGEGVRRVHPGADPRGRRARRPRTPAFELWVWTTSGLASFSAPLMRRR